MAMPTQPTTTSICTEALTRYLNGATPTSADITRAGTYGFEKVKRDIMNLGRSWKPLISTCYDLTVEGIPQYSNPADFEKDFSVGLMTADREGLLSAVASASSVTLEVDEDAIKTEVVGKLLLLTSGTYAKEAQFVSAYNSTTRVCTMETAFSGAPSVNDGYMIVNSIFDLYPLDLALYDQFQHFGKTDEPKRFTQIPDGSVGKLALKPIPDDVYGIHRRYYVDLMKLDTTSTLYNTILRRWAGVFEQGVYVWKLTEDDDRYAAQNEMYQAMLMALMASDMEGFDPAALKQGG